MNIISGILSETRHRIRRGKEAIEIEDYWSEISRKIAPSSIQEYPDHILIDDHTYIQCIIAGVPSFEAKGYPKRIDPSLLDRLLDISSENYTITYTIGLEPISLTETTSMLNTAEFNNFTNTQAAREQNNVGFASSTHSLIHQDIADRMKTIYDQDSNMFYGAFIITIWSNTKEGIIEANSIITGILASKLIDCEVPYYRMLETYMAGQPYPSLPDYTKTDMFTDHASLLIPTRNPNSHTSDRGLYVGNDTKTGKNILIDFTLQPAQHMMIVGPSGSGKTFSLLLFLMRAHDMLDKRIIYITPKSDEKTNHRSVAAYYEEKANIIDIGRGRNNINPLQILFDKTIDVTSWDHSIAYDTQKEIVISFFQTWLRDEVSTNMESYLDETLNKLYAAKNIYRDRLVDWTKVEWPVLAELRDIWAIDMKTKGIGSRQQTAEALWNKTYRVGWDGSLSYLNQPTNIDLTGDFIVIDFSRLSEMSGSIGDAMNVLITSIMGMRFSKDTRKETIIAMDEGVVFLQNKRLGEFLMRVVTQGRSAGIALWISTQHTTDLVKAGVSDELKTNMHVKIALGNMHSDSVKPVGDFFNLDQAWRDSLMTAGIGEGLVIVGDEKTPVKFTPSKHEYNIIKNTLKTLVKPSLDSVLLKEDVLFELCKDNKFYLADWCENPEILSKLGYKSETVQRAVGRGTARAWIDKTLIQGGKIGVQSIDHYATVLQIAAHLQLEDWVVTVHHHHDVDIVAEKNGSIIVFEYERPGSHSPSELVKKLQFAENTYGRCFFVVTGENENDVKSAIGRPNLVVRRGTQLEGLISGLSG